MQGIEERLAAIEARNAHVESNKGWETSWTRRGLIAAMTYLCALILLNLLGHEGSYKHALVPVMGYLVSTLSLPPAKEFWLQRHRSKKV